MRDSHLTSTQIHILNDLLNSKDPISSQFLANGLGVSSKTIRKCIDEMQNLLSQNGAVIDIKPGSGYKLVIQDEEAFDELKQVEQIGKRNRSSFPIHEDRAHLVIRYLLTHQERISIEDLCDLLYINRTSAKKILSKAREILAMFDLKAVFQSKKGIVVVGQEKDIRLCLVYEYSYFMTSYHFHGQEEYKDMIGINDPYLNEVEELIITLQNNFEEYNLSSYSVMYIARLIIVSKNRNLLGHKVELDDEYAQHYCKRNTYFVAKMILKECEKLYDMAFTCEDCILIAMSIVALRVTLKEPEAYRYGYFAHKDLALDIVQEISRLNLFPASKQDIQLIEDLSYSIEGLLERYKYHILTSQFRLIGYPYYSQMSYKMAMQIAYYLKKTQGIKLIPEDVIRLMMIIHPLFGRYPFVFDKYNACIISGVDKTEAKGLRERLLRNFGTYIRDIDLIERYEVKRKDMSKYRVVFSYCPKELLDIPEDIIYINISIFFDELDKERLRGILMRLSTYDTQVFAFKEHTKIFTDIKAHNKEECFEMISSIMNKECHADEKLLSDLKECEDILPTVASDNVVILTGLESHTDDIQINIFILDKPISWTQSSKAKIIVYWDRGRNPQESRNFEDEYIPHVIDRFFHHSEYVDDFIKNPTIEEFDEIVQIIDGQVMTNGASFQ